MNRRGFLSGGVALLVAPSIVRVSSLMPVSVLDFDTNVMRYKATERYAGFYMSDAFRELVLPGLRAAFDEQYAFTLKPASA